MDHFIQDEFDKLSLPRKKLLIKLSCMLDDLIETEVTARVRQKINVLKETGLCTSCKVKQRTEMITKNLPIRKSRISTPLLGTIKSETHTTSDTIGETRTPNFDNIINILDCDKESNEPDEPTRVKLQNDSDIGMFTLEKLRSMNT